MRTLTESTQITQDDKSSIGKVRRRRFLGAGSAVTVLASLKSGSALAQGVCICPSAFTSIAANPATSHKPRELKECHSHGYWKGKPWPISQDTKVSAVFCLSSRTTIIGITTETKLIEVLNMNGGGNGEDVAFARDLIAAYLDSFGNGIGAFTASDIQQMWSLVFCGGMYPATGPQWTRATVRAFLNVLIGDAVL